MPEIVPMAKRIPKRDEGRSMPDNLLAIPLPDADEESPSIATINKWIALADIALGQGIGRKIA
jgi:hypothetical protein